MEKAYPILDRTITSTEPVINDLVHRAQQVLTLASENRRLQDEHAAHVRSLRLRIRSRRYAYEHARGMLLRCREDLKPYGFNVARQCLPRDANVTGDIWAMVRGEKYWRSRMETEEYIMRCLEAELEEEREWEGRRAGRMAQDMVEAMEGANG